MMARMQAPTPRSLGGRGSVSRLRPAAARLAPVLVASLRGDEPSPIDADLSDLLGSNRVAAMLPTLAEYHRIGPWVQRALAAQGALPQWVATELTSRQHDA